MTKRELVAQIETLTNTIQGLRTQVAQTVESQEWQTANIVALESNLKALSTLPNIMRDSLQGTAKEAIKLVKMNKYQIPAEFTVEYWFRLNKWGDWHANSCELELAKIKSEDPALQRFYILTALKYAKLFNSAVLYKDEKTGMWKPGVWTWVDLDKKEIEYTDNITSTAITIKNQSLSFEGKSRKGKLNEDVIMLQNNDINIGDYVLLIPWVGKEIFFERQLQKNVSFLQIIPSSPMANEKQKGQLVPLLSDCENWYADETVDRQVGVNVESIKGNKLKWITPPVEIKETFEVIRNTLKDIREDFCQRFGKPVECSFNNKQHLNSDANMVVTNVEYTAKAWYNTYEDLMLQLIEKGIYEDQIENIEKEMDEKFDEQKGQSIDESAKDKGETNDVGESNKEVK